MPGQLFFFPGGLMGGPMPGAMGASAQFIPGELSSPARAASKCACLPHAFHHTAWYCNALLFPWFLGCM